MQEKIGAAPTLVYPESDGKPMAETPRHQQEKVEAELARLRETLERLKGTE